MKTIVLGRKVSLDIFGDGNTLEVTVLPLSPAKQLQLASDEYLSDAGRLDSLSAKEERNHQEEKELSVLNRKLAVQMEEINLKKIAAMTFGYGKADLIQSAKDLGIATNIVEILEDELKKSNEPITEQLAK